MDGISPSQILAPAQPSLGILRSKTNLPAVHIEPAPSDENHQGQDIDNLGDHDPHVPGAWIHPSQAVVAVPEPLIGAGDERGTETNVNLWRRLGDGIRNGDSMPTDKSTYESKGPVERRALIIGGQYETDTRNTPLPGTPKDILNIYRMLLKHGYKKENIRILLARAVNANQYKCQPTKKNIVKSLEWLVRGTRRGDYRYFHFSGHGEIFEDPSGKLARKIPEGGADPKEDDSELYGDATDKLRIASQMIDVSEVKRYSEALSAYCHDKPPHATCEFDVVDWRNSYRIRDEELNQAFSSLPAGSTLTCTIDCCHSGRIANNNFKLRGAGFRGSLVCDENAGLKQPVSHVSPLQDVHFRAGTEPEINRGVILRNGPISELCEAKICLPLQLSLHGSMGLGEVRYTNDMDAIGSCELPRGLTGFATSVYRYFCPPTLVPESDEHGGNFMASGKVKMEEKLPADEVKKDNIKANMLTWGGCHQRQVALEGDRGGYFTSAFVKGVEEVSGRTSTVGELFDIVNAKVVEMMRRNANQNKAPLGSEASATDEISSTTKGINLQYIQLWTSIGGEGSDLAQSSKLNERFII